MIYNAALYQVDHLMCRILLKYTSYFDFGREHVLKITWKVILSFSFFFVFLLFLF